MKGYDTPETRQDGFEPISGMEEGGERRDAVRGAIGAESGDGKDGKEKPVGSRGEPSEQRVMMVPF
ncbi:unnamed protein product [Arabis nemorensis]|uniref:Uncharacterized protein n=1 Tax=Arabis nemorensis TaxID=586526 RepID=A0A565BJY0_9BRAS|nr:unnamed protein product [Arabis nemorensis]